MAHDAALAARIRAVLGSRADVEEKPMFGGLTFMVAGHMCCGVAGEELVARIGPARAAGAVAEPHVRPCDFTGRPMKGMVSVAPAGLGSDEALKVWVDAALAYVETLPPKG